jgi:outer membrane protein assembly factor BamB
MKAVHLKCPQCGATLQGAGDATDVTCTYCGTVSQIQQRATVFQRLVPSRADVMRARMAAQPASNTTGTIVIVVTLLVLASFLVPVALVVSDCDGGGGRAGSTLGWEGTGSLLFADVDGDGRGDVVGRGRVVGSADLVHVIALDGVTGAQRWKSAALGTYNETYQGMLLLAGSHAVFVSPRGGVTAVRLEDGTLAWTATLPERVTRPCAGAPDVLALELTDGRQVALDTSTGAVEAEAPAPPPHLDAAEGTCVALPTDRDDASDRPRADTYLTDALAMGHSIELRAGPYRVVSGPGARGARVPVLARVDEAGTQVWRVDVPSDRLGAKESAAEHPLLAAPLGLACAEWEVSASGRNPPRLACFELDSGARRWEATLASDLPLEAVVAGDALVYTSSWGTLQAFDPATGASRWTFGR